MGKETQEEKANGLQIKQSQINNIIALVLMLFFLFFISGFYWGRRTALKNVLSQFEKDSLSDKVSYAFCNLQESFDLDNLDETSQTESTDNLINESSADKSIPDNSALDESASDESGDGLLVKNSSNSNKFNEVRKMYRAYLAGFGTEKMALKCINSMQAYGFDVELFVRNSKTMKGRIITWYQVVTKPVDDMELLQNIIEKARKRVKLGNDIQIVTLENVN